MFVISQTGLNIDGTQAIGITVFLPANVDPNLCTHIIYSFAKLEPSNYAINVTEWNDITIGGKGRIEEIMDLKLRNPNLKILLGLADASRLMSKMVRDEDLRSHFIETTVDFLLKHKFDGLDINQYPANMYLVNSTSDDNQLFTKLCEDLKVAFSPSHLLLTASVSSRAQIIDAAYEITGIAPFLDFINVICYDFRGTADKFTGLNTALYASEEMAIEQRQLTVDFAIKHWLQLDFPKEKINLAIAFYGRTFSLRNPKSHNIGSGVLSGGKAGNITREMGTLSYYEICTELAQGWTRAWDDIAKVPYAYGDNQWVSYEDKESLKIKTDYIKSLGLGGASIWSLDNDDFEGSFCNQGAYPLLNAVRSNLLETPARAVNLEGLSKWKPHDTTTLIEKNEDLILLLPQPKEAVGNTLLKWKQQDNNKWFEQTYDNFALKWKEISHGNVINNLTMVDFKKGGVILFDKYRNVYIKLDNKTARYSFSLDQQKWGIYEHGEWVKGIDNVLMNFENGVYWGSVNKDHKFHGFGGADYIDNERYIGFWANGIQNGKGVFVFKDGSQRYGYWINGKSEGLGIFIWKNGDRYEGHFLNGKKSGKGVLIYANGDTYNGHFVEDKREGSGEFIAINGDLYRGNWENGNISGMGMKKFANGTIVRKIWTNETI